MTNDAMREKLVAVANLLKDLTVAVVSVAEEFGEVKVETEEPKAVEKKEEPKAAEPEKKFTFEEVRKAMSAKSGAGYTAEVRGLLEKYGASRLSEVKETDYAAIMEEVQTIGSTQ